MYPEVSALISLFILLLKDYCSLPIDHLNVRNKYQNQNQSETLIATGGINLQTWLTSPEQGCIMDGCSVSLSDVSSNTGSVVEHCMSILYSPGVRKTTVHSWNTFADSARDVNTTLKAHFITYILMRYVTLKLI